MFSKLIKFLKAISSKRGFTLLELLIFVAIFVIIITSFIAVLISVLRVQNRETSVVEVNRQSQFVMNIVQRYVEESSMIEMEAGATTTILTLRMPSSSDNVVGTPPAQTFIYLENSQIFLKEKTNGIPQPLTSDRVVVDKLEFKKHATLGGHDSVDVVLTLHYASPNIQRQFTQALQTSVARINAATFDSSIVPSSTPAILDLGVSGRTWKSVNGIIKFSPAYDDSVGINIVPGSSYVLHVSHPSKGINFDVLTIVTGANTKVGIGTTNLYQSLNVQGNIRLTGPALGCGITDLGTIAYDSQPINDRVKVCVKINVGGVGTPTWLYLLATTTDSIIH